LFRISLIGRIGRRLRSDLIVVIRCEKEEEALGIGGSIISVSVRWTSVDDCRRAVVRAWPMKPEAPVIRICILGREVSV